MMVAYTTMTPTIQIEPPLVSSAAQGKRTGQSIHDAELYEIINGEKLYRDATGGEHGWVELNVASAIRDYVRPQRLGRVQVGEVGIYIQRNPDRVRAADVLFISLERYAQLSNPGGYLDVAPELVVEVLSPDDTVIGMMQKLRDYFSIGVHLIWLIDPEAHTVFAYRSLTDVREFTAADTLPGDEVLPGFAVPVASLFEA
jgi:Uma2 family endonuclease